MTRIIAIAILTGLTGCAQLAGSMPTFEYCSEVRYTRIGNQIDVTAKCAAPIGGGALPGMK